MSDDVDTTKWSSAALVAVFGGIGGVAAWIWSMTVDSLSKSADIADVAVNVFLGCVAGFVSVYAIKIDPSRVLMHSLALALLSGFAWKPMLEAGRELVITNIQQGEVAEQSEVARNAMDALQNASPDKAPMLIEQLESVLQKLMKSAESVRRPAISAEIDTLLVEAVGALSQKANVAPEEAARALGSIGAAAVGDNRTAIATAAETSLVRIAQEKDFEVGTSSEVSNALLRISAAARANRRDDTAATFRLRSKEVFEQSEARARKRDPQRVQELRERSMLSRELPTPGGG